MPVLHISEADAIRDFASVMAKVRAGAEIVIEAEDSSVAAHLVPALEECGQKEAGYDEWFRSAIEVALKSDPATDLDESEVAAHFAQHRRELLQRLGKSA